MAENVIFGRMPIIDKMTHLVFLSFNLVIKILFNNGISFYTLSLPHVDYSVL